MIPKKYEFIVFALFMSTFMSILMSGVVTLINVGFIDKFFSMWLIAFVKSFAVAFPTIIIVIPQVRRIVSFLIEK